MTVDEYAALERQLGAAVRLVDGVWWRRVRPFFYRPLYLFRPLAPALAHTPALARWGGLQYPVRVGSPANSWLHYVMAEPASPYTVENLGKKDARAIRVAQKKITVDRIELAGTLVRPAHEVYLEFHHRTRYKYKAERRNWDKFTAWAAIIHAFPKLLVQGAFVAGQLRAVSISLRVEDTVFFATLFSANEMLKLGGADLMLHTVRQAAANAAGVNRIFATMFKGGDGHDRFYLHRGFQQVSVPAVLRIHPGLALALRCCAPGAWAHLRGELPVGNAGR